MANCQHCVRVIIMQANWSIIKRAAAAAAAAVATANGKQTMEQQMSRKIRSWSSVRSRTFELVMMHGVVAKIYVRLPKECVEIKRIKS